MTLIETRGEGGYAIVPPSPPDCHPNRTAYQLLQGDLAWRPALTPAEQTLLLDAARALDELEEPVGGLRAPQAVLGGSVGRDRPGDDYNRRGTWRELLTRHGWQLAGERGGLHPVGRHAPR